MTLQELARFIAIVDAGSINAAASALRLSQPALSMQVLQLEKKLDTKLLIRTSRGVVPTDAGAALYRQAHLVVRTVEEIPELIANSVLEPAGHVNVGFSASLASAFGVPLVKRLRASYPKIIPQLIEAPATIQKELAASNRIDFALVLAEPDSEDIMLTPFYKQTLFVVAPAEHPADRLTLAEFLSGPLVLPSKENPIRIVLDRAAQVAGLKPQVAVECRSMTNLLQTVRSDVGLAILPWIPVPLFGEKRPLFRFIEIVDVQLDLLVCLCESTARSSSASLLAKNALYDTVLSAIRSPSWRGATPF
ncbi:MAG: LysR substrate-binding domain-containing protein [Rhizobiaceae bacterium]